MLLAGLMRDPLAAYARLPIVEADLLTLAPYAERWFDEAAAAKAAEDRERLDEIAQSDAAMLVTAGWNDLFLEGSLELFATARSRRDESGARPDRLIIGPWSHGNPQDWQGSYWHGYTSSTEGLSDIQLDFFEAAMAGKCMDGPVVRYFRSGSCTWHAAPDWPLPAASARVFYLDGDRLSGTPSEKDWSRSYVSDPAKPVPTTGGATFLPGLLLGRNSGPKEQSGIESRDDLLVFTTDPIVEEMEVTGRVTATIYVQSSAPTADWTARLCEVDEDGRSVGLVDGIARWVNPEPDGNGPSKVVILLGHIGHLFRARSRIRLQIASSNFPRFNRNPQSGVPANRARASDFAPARQTVCGGPGISSRISLAVVPESYPVLATMSASP